MKRWVMILVCVIFFIEQQYAEAQQIFNGDLENIDPATKLPTGWSNYMGDRFNYDFKLDSNVVEHGKYAISISSTGRDGTFGAISFVIPKVFQGYKIQLKGYIKTENVTQGYAGFWLRIDGSFALNNMEDQNVHGTTGWKEYSISLPYNNKTATTINAGALLTGKGKMWFDNMRLYIGNQPIEKVPLKVEEAFEAQKDTAFVNGSGINYTGLNDQQVKNLTLLAQVWGFIKYHLPNVASGKINMDAELLRIMPKVIEAKNYTEADTAIEQWVDKLGGPVNCADCNMGTDKNIAQKPDYGEIFDTSIVGLSLGTKLALILAQRSDYKSYYIEMLPGVGNPSFKHELAYAKMAYPDAGYRLLTLFRFWNMIQYFYPDKHLIGEDWNKVLPEFIAKFMEAKDQAGYEVATLELVCRIHDSHAGIGAHDGLNSYFGRVFAPFDANFIEDKLVVTGYFNDTLSVKDNIKVGDVIEKINGIGVAELVIKYLPYTSASNYTTQLLRMPGSFLLRGKDSTFAFEILRDGKTITVIQKGLPRNRINYGAIYKDEASKPGYYLIDGNIGYLYPGKFHVKDMPGIKQLFKDTRGIIVDMRTYPSDNITYSFVPYIKSENARYVKFTFGSVTTPGVFTEGAPQGIKPENGYKGKVVVIVNEVTQSQAEFATMAFQSSPNVTVIGSTTAGADGNVSSIVLPGGITTLISGIGVLYPDGTETQRKGVKIDVVVKPTIEGIKAGRDEPLEKAKAIILGGS